MVIDIILLAIVIITGLWGIRKGFMYTFIHTAGWIMSIVLAFIATPMTKTYIMENTGLYDQFIPTIPVPEGVPKIVSDVTTQVTGNFIFTILTYMALLIIINLVLYLTLRLLSKSYHGGAIGFIDGFFGLLIGLAKGAIICLVVLAAIIPVLEIIAPEQIAPVLANLETSMVSKTIYDNNIIVLVLQNFFAEVI